MLAKRVAFADGIRAYAALSVVVVHTSATLLYTSVGSSGWWIANVFASAMQPVMPLFVMLSGILLLDPSKEDSLKAFFVKRVRRVVLPFFAWGVIYLCWRALFHGEALSVGAGVKAFVQGTIYSGFDFIYLLVGLYLVTPILRTYLRTAKPRDVSFFLILWFLAVTIPPMIAKFAQLQLALKVPVVASAVGYFVLGHALRDVRLRKLHTALLGFGVVGLTAVTAVGTGMLSTTQKGDFFLYNTLTPNMILLAVSVFLVVKSLPWDYLFSRSTVARGVVTATSLSSLGVYFMNFMVLETLRSGRLGFVLRGTTVHPLLGIPMTALVAAACCVVLSTALRRIPLARDLLGK